MHNSNPIRQWSESGVADYDWPKKGYEETSSCWPPFNHKWFGYWSRCESLKRQNIHGKLTLFEMFTCVKVNSPQRCTWEPKLLKILLLLSPKRFTVNYKRKRWDRALTSLTSLWQRWLWNVETNVSGDKALVSPHALQTISYFSWY